MPFDPSPFSLTLAPGQSKIITLKPLEQVVQEQVYRLDVRPLVELSDSDDHGASGSVRLNLAFSILVRQMPSTEKVSLKVLCDLDGTRLNC